MADLKKKPHREKKSPGSRDVFDKQRKERNAARGRQVYVKGPALTAEQLDAMSDEEILALPQPYYTRVKES